VLGGKEEMRIVDPYDLRLIKRMKLIISFTL